MLQRERWVILLLITQSSSEDYADLAGFRYKGSESNETERSATKKSTAEAAVQDV